MSAGSQNLLALVVAMLVFAILPFSLAIITMRGSSVALSRVRLKEKKTGPRILNQDEKKIEFQRGKVLIKIGKKIRRPNIL